MNIDSAQQRMYTNVPNLVLGFHGCDKSVADDIINYRKPMNKSTNTYDWLGNGMYFWEQNLKRAWQWAEEMARYSKSSVKEPAVIGAVIDLGYCLNFLDSHSIELLQIQYDHFTTELEFQNKPMPKNWDPKGLEDRRNRELDCAVIENLHISRKNSGLQSFDSVRGMFTEGKPIYETAGFYTKTHIQIAVRNPNCIKGFFLPRDVNSAWNIP